MASEQEGTIEKLKLVDLFEHLVSQKKYAEFVESINKKTKDELNYEAWELAPKLCQYLHPKSKPKLLNTCTLTLNHLASVCDPKDLLLIFVELINDAAKLKDTLFLNLLDPIFICLRRIEYPKSQAMSLVFTDLYKRISYLKLPKEYELENKERQLLEFDTSVQTILKWLVPLQNRVEDLLMQSVAELRQTPTRKKEMYEFMKLEIKILSQPLAYFDLSHEKETKSGSRNVAESCLKVLHSLRSDTVRLLAFCSNQNDKHEIRRLCRNVEESEDESEKPFAERGCAVLAYLVFGENLAADSFPYIYTSQFLFEFNAPNYLHLLQETKSSLLVYKGLVLCTNLLKRLSPSIWRSEFLEWSPMVELLKSLMFVASSTKLKEFQKSSLQLIASLVEAFRPEARSKLYHFLLTRCPRQVVVGFVIALLKKEIEEGLKEKDLEIDKKPIREILELEKLYQVIFSLPKGEKSDLVEYAEQIMGALNLLRFALETDPREENETGVWTVLPLVESKYFAVLGSGIELSRSHYRLEIKKIRDSRSEKAASGVALDDPESKQKLSDAHRIAFLEKAIHTFDMMEEVLGKVSGLVRAAQK